MKQAEGLVVVSAISARSPRKIIFVLAVASEAHEPSFASTAAPSSRYHHVCDRLVADDAWLPPKRTSFDAAYLCVELAAVQVGAPRYSPSVCCA